MCENYMNCILLFDFYRSNIRLPFAGVRRCCMNIVIGLLIGVAIGAAQLFLLVKFVKGVTAVAAADDDDGKGGTAGYMAAGMIQLLLPFLALIAVAFLYRDALLWAGIGAGTSLIILGVITALLKKK